MWGRRAHRPHIFCGFAMVEIGFRFWQGFRCISPLLNIHRPYGTWESHRGDGILGGWWSLAQPLPEKQSIQIGKPNREYGVIVLKHQKQLNNPQFVGAANVDLLLSLSKQCLFLLDDNRV